MLEKETYQASLQIPPTSQHNTSVPVAAAQRRLLEPRACKELVGLPLAPCYGSVILGRLKTRGSRGAVTVAWQVVSYGCGAGNRWWRTVCAAGVCAIGGST